MGVIQPPHLKGDAAKKWQEKNKDNIDKFNASGRNKSYNSQKTKILNKTMTPEQLAAAEKEYGQAEVQRWYNQGGKVVEQPKSKILNKSMTQEQLNIAIKEYGREEVEKWYGGTLPKQQQSSAQPGKNVLIEAYNDKLKQHYIQQSSEYSLMDNRRYQQTTPQYSQYTGIIPTEPTPDKYGANLVSAAPQKKWYDLPGRMRDYSIKHEDNTKSQLTIQGAKVFGAGVIAGATYPIFHPIKTVKGVASGAYSLVTKPRQTVQSFAKEVSLNPLTTTGEIAGGFVFGGAVTKAAKVGASTPVGRSVIPKYENVVFPAKGGGSYSMWKGLKVNENPILGVSEKRIRFGYPKSTPRDKFNKVDIGGEFVPESKLQTRFFKHIARRKGFVDESGVKIKRSTAIMSKTEFQLSKFNQLFPKETKTLSPKGTAIVKDFLKKEKGLAYGSWAVETQMPKGRTAAYRGDIDALAGKPVAGDIDVQLNLKAADTDLRAAALTKQLQKAGEKVRISPQKNSLIESRGTDGQWHHAVDIHSIDDALTESLPVKGAYGFKFGQKPIKKEGIRTMRLSEQGLRKGSATLIADETTGLVRVNPKPHRMKDIPDFLATQRTLIDSMRPGMKRLSARRQFDSLEKLYIRQGKIVSEGRMQFSISNKADTTASVNLLPVTAASKDISRNLNAQNDRSIRLPRSKSHSPSRPMGVSRSLSVSASASLSKAVSIPRSRSRSPSNSIRSPSLVPSVSRSVSPYRSPSFSLNPSFSPSPSFTPSPSPPFSPSLSPPSSPPYSPPFSPPSSPPYSPPFSPSFTPSPPIKPPKGFNLLNTNGRRSGFFNFNPRYVSSIRASALKIRGKATAFDVKSGLTLRPLKL